MTGEAPAGGWLEGRRRRVLVGIADRAAAIAAVHIELGEGTNIMAVTRVPQAVLEISNVMPGKIVEV